MACKRSAVRTRLAPPKFPDLPLTNRVQLDPANIAVGAPVNKVQTIRAAFEEYKRHVAQFQLHHCIADAELWQNAVIFGDDDGRKFCRHLPAGRFGFKHALGKNLRGGTPPDLLMVVFQSSFIAAQLFFDALDRLLEACVNISVIAGGVQIKAAVEVQRTIGLKAIPLTRENNIYVGGTIEIFFYRTRQSGFDMRAQGFTCLDLASGNVDFHEYSPFLRLDCMSPESGLTKPVCIFQQQAENGCVRLAPAD